MNRFFLKYSILCRTFYVMNYVKVLNQHEKNFTERSEF